MFYSDVILSKRGPLAKVWLAAHAERRLTKAQLIQTDIEETVASIIGQDVMPMALRLSGQLLLGVTRIYSRKAKFLLDDCSDALMKLKTAFRTGTIDFTTDMAPIAAQHNNVTLPLTHTAYDFALPDPALEGWDADSSMGPGEGSTSGHVHSNRYTARPEDITLRRYLDTERRTGSDSMVGWASGDFFDPDGTNADVVAGDLTSPGQVQRRDSDGRPVDANGDPVPEGDEEDLGDTSSIGIGRDVQMQLGGQRPSLGISGDLTGFDDFGVDEFMLSGIAPADMSGGGGIDLGLDDFDAQRRSVTPVRQTDASLFANLTPRTAKSVKQAAMKRAAASVKRTKRQQMIDARTQLDDGRNARSAQTSAEGIVLVDSTCLPRSAEHLRLLMLQQDPSNGVLPFAAPDAFGRQTFTAARSLAPQLTELFNIDMSFMTRRRAAAVIDDDDDGRAQKRIRGADEEENNDEDFASEIGRRQMPDVTGGHADLTVGQSISYDDGFDAAFEHEAPVFDIDEPELADRSGGTQMTLRRSQRKRAADDSAYRETDDNLRQRAFNEENALQRLGTPSERSFVLGAADLSPSSSNPLRAFDTLAASAESDAGLNNTAADVGNLQTLGISKNTVRAVKVLQAQLDPENNGEQVTVTVQDITQGATRKAAAAFFFECLALGTKDCLDITQDQAYGEIRMKAKPTMWTSFDEILA